MKKKTAVSIIAIALAFLLMVSLMLSVIGSLGALADSSSFQDQIDAIEDQKNELQAEREEMQANINDLLAQRETVLEKKAVLDERNLLAQEEIELINEQIDVYTGLIEQKEIELEEAQAAEEEQYELYSKRVRAMEENGSYTYLDILFRCRSLGELLSAMDDISEIMDSDRRLYEKYMAARENTESIKTEYEQTLDELGEKQTELEEDKADLEAQIEEAVALIADLDEDIEQARQEYLANEAAEQALNSQMNSIAQQLWELEQQQQQQQKPTQPDGNNGSGESGGESGGESTVQPPDTSTVTGTYIWPTPSCTIVTSPYGNRPHPIFGTERFHSGIDIGAAAGASVLASDGGTVTVATYSSSYGNYVMIYHSNGTYTLYAHMSSLAVSAGQTVTQGQTIGYVGSTGWTTGPHLHFEIRNASGGTVDPLRYFSGITVME